MPDARDEGDARGNRTRRKQLALAGRLLQRERGRIRLELIDGLTLDIAEDDCVRVQEKTDPTTLRPLVMVELRGEQPISAAFQPHLYRVLADAAAVPFVFGGSAGVSPEDFALAVAQARAAPIGGGGGTPHHTTAMMCTTWMGTTQKDGSKGDSAGEPDEIFLP
jgi:hypothetical protein